MIKLKYFNNKCLYIDCNKKRYDIIDYLKNNYLQIIVAKQRKIKFIKHTCKFKELSMLAKKKYAYELYLLDNKISIKQYLKMGYTLFGVYKEKIIDQEETLDLIDNYNILNCLNL